MKPRGFTLIELMSALAILSLLAVLSFRGLGAVLEARDQVRQETQKWRSVAAFFARLQRDVQLSAPSPLRGTATGFEFSRFATVEGTEVPRQLAYRLNEKQEVELSQPARHTVLSSVARFELQYLDGALAWLDAWPGSERDPLPRALRLRIVLASGEDLVRVFALKQ